MAVKVSEVKSSLNTSIKFEDFWDKQGEVLTKIKQEVYSSKTDEELDNAVEGFTAYAECLAERFLSEAEGSTNYNRLKDLIDYTNSSVVVQLNSYAKHFKEIDSVTDEQSIKDFIRIDYLYDTMHQLKSEDVKVEELRELVSRMIAIAYTDKPFAKVYEIYLNKVQDVKHYLS